MIFLIHYDRTTGRLIDLRAFPQAQRSEASAAKLDIEISLLSEPDGREVVLLEAQDEESLRKTHRRYFDSLTEMKSDQTAEYPSTKTAMKYWEISPSGKRWLVHSENIKDVTYPDKESALAAAARDAGKWHEANGRPAGVRVKRSDGGWQDFGSFGAS